MAVGSPPLRPARSQALDDLIMGTNSSSIVSKRSVERLYYPNEPHYFRYFVKKPLRRAPLINRGYWLRLKAIDVIVRKFLEQPSSKKKVVINLGCGYDVLPWQCHVRSEAAAADALFVDVDYPDLMRKKRAMVLQTPELRDLIGTDAVISESEKDPVLLRSARYCQLACDLRELQAFRECLESLVPLEEAQVLFVAEVSVTYMDTQSADSLIHWASTIGQAEFCLLEQILPNGPNHPFAKTMLAHFDKLKTSLRSVHQYQTLESQHDRFKSRGWKEVNLRDLWEAWTGDDFLTPDERRAIDDVEPFDEWEELMLFGRHYVVLHATATTPNIKSRILSTKAPYYGLLPELDINGGPYTATKPLKRRFGNAMAVSNVEGKHYAIHLLGLGADARSETYDVFGLSYGGTPAYQLPLSGPLPRMCATMTDLGDYGVLLTGGRASPSKAMDDCWIFHKGSPASWEKTWNLPKPLYRHSAVRLPGSSLSLIVGGKTGPADVSSDAYVFHPDKGWLTCELSMDSSRPQIFGAALCNSSTPASERACFEGILFGGMKQDGTLNRTPYWWHLQWRSAKPRLTFKEMNMHPSEQGALSVFGASVAHVGSKVVICGGTGDEPSVQGQHMIVLGITAGSVQIVGRICPSAGSTEWPFMIGSSVLSSGGQLTVLGGGAVCFSMGSFWETRQWRFALPSGNDYQELAPAHISCDFLESPKILGKSQDTDATPHSEQKGPITVQIPRLKLTSDEQFRKLMQDGKPVVITGLNIGVCLSNWTPEYMVEQVGREKQVVVHECREDSEKMDFNSKNFQYVADSFANIMDRIQAGGRLYLRSLSHEKPTEAPANVGEDFPELAKDFTLPDEVRFVRENLFSSVLRISGRVNMWLHYDVMSNVYSQVIGTKRMVLFPPSDVPHLHFAPGSSSSSLDVFQSLPSNQKASPATSTLSKTHPHEALLGPGDMLLIPATWLHTATPTSDMSVAVNVFFRDLEEGKYATGRDVYGNRDLAAYEKGRADVAKLVRGFERVPEEVRKFYLMRLADEMLQACGRGN